MHSYSAILLCLAIASTRATAHHYHRHRDWHQPQRSTFYADKLQHRSSTTSCENTHGPGSIQCGYSDTVMCYNPSKGQSCCADNGYCEHGQYCAPVTGYCCLIKESLHECALSAGFQVPSMFPVRRTRGARNASDIKESTTVTPTPTRRASHIQISAVARKEQHTLTWMGLSIGIVGVIMATF